MRANTAWIKIDPKRAACVLTQDATEKLASSAEVVLDFASVGRIDTTMVGALENLARLAGERSVTVVLHGVNLDIYKALKLANLTHRFCFLS